MLIKKHPQFIRGYYLGLLKAEKLVRAMGPHEFEWAAEGIKEYRLKGVLPKEEKET